jgi:hypothetical protein
MDKVFLGAFLSSLVGFLTAAISVVKLVNEKESKTTDYRQAWTTSARQNLSDLISNLNLYANNILRRYDAIEQFTHHLVKENKDDTDEALQSHFEKSVTAYNTIQHELRTKIQQSYSLARLHFKPNDLSFSRIENKFDIIMALFAEIKPLLDQYRDSELPTHIEKIHTHVSELTDFSRDILKTEWEAVKKGEKSYQYTKNLAIWGGGTLFLTLIIFGVYVLIKVAPNNFSVLFEHNKESIHSQKEGTNTSCPASSNTQTVTITNGTVSLPKTSK